MTIHDEKVHPRGTSGKWENKTQSSPDISIGGGRMANYETTAESETGIWYFSADGELHRTNGPAVERDGEENYYYLNGVEVFPPDTSGYDLQSVASDGSMTWTSGSGNRVVTVDPDGRTEFRRDGDIHRDGGPAVIEADGTELWHRNDHHIDSPWPTPPVVTPDLVADTVTTTGSRFIEGADPKALAAILRKEIAYAAETGILDDLGIAYTVRFARNRYQDRPEINVDVVGLRQDRIVRPGDDGSKPFHTDEVLAIRNVLDQLGGSHNRTTVHNGTDSIQSPFWFNVNIPTTR